MIGQVIKGLENELAELQFHYQLLQAANAEYKKQLESKKVELFNSWSEDDTIFNYF